MVYVHSPTLSKLVFVRSVLSLVESIHLYEIVLAAVSVRWIPTEALSCVHGWRLVVYGAHLLVLSNFFASALV